MRSEFKVMMVRDFLLEAKCMKLENDHLLQEKPLTAFVTDSLWVLSKPVPLVMK